MELRSLFPTGQRTLEAFNPSELGPLVSARSFELGAECAAEFTLPAHTVCFETRLAADDDRVDVAFGICAEPGLAGFVGELEQRFGDDSDWARFTRFMRAWTTPGSPLIWQVPFVCAAFEVVDSRPERRARLQAPCASLCIDPSFFLKRMGLDPALSMSREELTDLVRMGYEELSAREFGSIAKARLARLLSSDRVEPKHVSVMVGRPGTPLKVDLRLRSEEVVPYLEHIAWPGCIRNIGRTLEELAPWRGHVQLNLVVHPFSEPTLELEVLAGEPEVSAADRVAFLERLVEARVSAEPKAQVLADVTANPLETDVTGFTVARNWYVKLRFDTDRLRDAKAYLALMPRLFLCTEGALGEARLEDGVP